MRTSHPSPRPRRAVAPFVSQCIGWVMITAAVTIFAVAIPTGSKSADAATKYRICHRTNAIKNPYRSIEVAWSALGPSDGTRHRIHDGVVFDVLDPEGSHGSTPRDETPGGGNDRWGDIFSHTKGSTRAHNWTPEGEAIYNGETFQLSDGIVRTACKSMGVKEYIQSEVDAGVALEDVMADLDDQDAAEDLALRNALGGSFSSWFTALPAEKKNLASIELEVDNSTPTVTTDEATGVGETSATLPGSSNPKGGTLSYRFEYSTDPALAGASSWTGSMTVDGASATSSNASTSVPVSALLTGLTPGYKVLL